MDIEQIMNEIEEKIDDIEDEINEKVDIIEAELNEKIEDSMDAREQNTPFESVEAIEEVEVEEVAEEKVEEKAPEKKKGFFGRFFR